MAQMRKPTPSRMALSPKVARPPTTDSRVREKRQQPGPFRALNATEARIREHRSSRKLSPKADTSRSKVRSGRKNQVKFQDDFKALKMQRALTGVTYARRSTIKSDISSVDSFEQFPLLPILQESIPTEGLKGLTNVLPTPIQKLAIPALLNRQDKSLNLVDHSDLENHYQQFLLAAETGSGKTLAYVLPLIDAVKRNEIKFKEEEQKAMKQETAWEREKRAVDVGFAPSSNAPHPTAGRPRGLVLVPTAELANQVCKVIKAFSHTVKFKASAISAELSVTVIRNRLFSSKGIDILISTPHLLSSIAEKEPNILSQVSHLVIDEADSMFDRSFAPITSAILDRAAPSLKQLILCSATIPRSLDAYLRKRFPDLTRLVTPKLHAIPRRLQLGVVDAAKDPYRGNKDLACADTIWTIGSAASENTNEENADEVKTEQKLVMVFVNEREKSTQLADFLVSKGIDAVALNRDSSDRNLSQTLSAFISREKTFDTARNDDESTKELPGPTKRPKQILKNTKVLVATDLGSRGIDTFALRNVILHDVPFNTIDFIHRLGRVGRMGRRGRAYVIVDRHDRRDVVREVQDSMYKGQALI